MDYFSDYEKQLLDSIINRVINEHWNAKKASGVSHGEIKSWKIGRARHNLKMLYSDELEGIEEKKQVN